MNATRLVLEREIRERVRSRLFRALTALEVVGVVALIVVPALVHTPAKPTPIGLVGPAAQALAPALSRTATAARLPVRLTPVPDAATARAELKRGTIAVALSLGPHAARAEVRQSLPATTAGLLRAVLNAAHAGRVLRDAGVPTATVAAASTPVPVETIALERAPADNGARQAAALAAGLLLYLTLGLYGTAVATGVAQEKTSRTAEVLLSAVRPRQLLTGKVAGIGLAGLGQTALAVVAGLIANSIVHGAQIPGTVWRLLPAILIWFLLGYTLYAFVSAAGGALVARQEEVQTISLPLMLPLLAGFLLVYVAIASPTSRWIEVLSFFPPFAPTLMPARIALGDTPVWQVTLAALLTVIAIYGLARLAARIYAPALVRGGARIGWRTAFQLGREHD